MFICEVCKAAPKDRGFKRRYQWKTEKAFKGHWCYSDELAKRASDQALREEREAQRAAEEAIKLEEWRAKAKYKPGDRLWLVYYWVSGPTHQANQWGRMVRVRYEELREYCTQHVTVKEIALGGYTLEEKRGIQYEPHLFTDYAEAVAKKNELEAKYAGFVKQSQEYR